MARLLVMNEKQLKERGISFFAKGVNVPWWNYNERTLGNIYRNSGTEPSVTKDDMVKHFKEWQWAEKEKASGRCT